MNRRGFLGAILAAAVAPAIVRADALMRIVPRETTVHHWDVTCEPGGVMVPDEFSGIFTGELGRWNGIRFVEQRINYGHGLAVAAYVDGEIPVGVMTQIWINDNNVGDYAALARGRLVDLLRPVIVPPSSPQATALRGSPLRRR